MPKLAARLADAKPVVQAAAMQLVRRLMRAAPPQAVLNALAPLASGAAAGPAAAREQALNAHIMVSCSLGVILCQHQAIPLLPLLACEM
jgi:hypothetical protein